MMGNQGVVGRSVPDGLGSADAPEPHSGLGPSGAIPSAAWLPMSDAPRDGTPIFGRTLDGFTLVAHYEQDGFVDEDGQDIGSWVAEYEGEHPEDWTDGVCWASNENEVPSDPLVAFVPITGIASQVADGCRYAPGSENYTRVYQGAFKGAKLAFRGLASGMETRSAETERLSPKGDSPASEAGDAQHE